MEFFARLTELTGELSGLLWGNPLTLLVLLGTGLYLTIRMGLIQVRGFRHAIDITLGRYDNPEDEGDLKHFQALTTAVSGTVGIGNIAGNFHAAVNWSRVHYYYFFIQAFQHFLI